MLKAITLDTLPMPIFTWQPIHPDNKKPIRIYIEGDGRAWIKRGRPSTNPTPKNQLIQRLVIQDPENEKAYLARPCQFIQNTECRFAVWTFQRYDHYIVELMNEAVEKIKHRGGYRSIELIGYSGGATIALLLAAKRSDVQSVRTIAGNLDPDFTNQQHGVSPMASAENPVSFAAQLTSVPQVHFYGSQDNIIPKNITEHYLKQLNRSNCVQTYEIKASHHTGWETQWNSLLERQPTCR